MDVELDTKGMNCPMPILKAKKAMIGMEPGQTLRIEATDPGAVEDFDAFCRTVGHEMVEQSEEAGIFIFVIKKKSS